MNIIKLDATESTNSYLKNLTKKMKLDDFTVVITHNQTKGRGQVNTQWVSEPGKNLTFSVFCEFSCLLISNQKYLNYAVSLTVLETLKSIKVPDLFIKWPNDILSGKQKVSGILVENSLIGNLITSSIIGIGLNVNQINFPSDIKQVTSVFCKTGEMFDIEELLALLLSKLKENITLLRDEKFDLLEEKYLNNLYKKDVPAMFKKSTSEVFMGMIKGVSCNGRLLIEKEDETIVDFGIKEVSFLE